MDIKRKTISNLVPIITLIIFCTGCDNNATSRVNYLTIENDSLKKELEYIKKNKYVFDSISLRFIRSEKNSYKINSNVQEEIVFVGYNLDKESPMRVILADSFVNHPSKKIFNPDTIKMNDKGGFNYSRKLDKPQINLRGILEVENKYGKKYQGQFNSIIKSN